ncbi:MAG TPA: haloacid dehalogenase type II [Acetobacteraceae bacterium]|nr:haloacid dehalogenase type II [Acetobacteraceae bacterium]
MRLSDFRALSFDCYGTLIDWETGLWTALRPLAERAGIAREPALEAFAAAESRQERATPALKYPALLAAVHAQLARAWNVATDAAEGARFGDSVGDWPAFSDTAEALRALQQHYKLVILSNIDRASFARSLPRLGVTFDAVCTAEDIGSYKPDPRNFAYLIEKLATLGIARSQALHTAQSLFHDHAPANAAGLASAWIDRRAGQAGAGATAAPPAGVRYDFRFTSLAEMAAARTAEER